MKNRIADRHHLGAVSGKDQQLSPDLGKGSRCKIPLGAKGQDDHQGIVVGKMTVAGGPEDMAVLGQHRLAPKVGHLTDDRIRRSGRGCGQGDGACGCCPVFCGDLRDDPQRKVAGGKRQHSQALKVDQGGGIRYPTLETLQFGQQRCDISGESECRHRAMC